MDKNNEFSVTPMNQIVDLVPGETYNYSITILNPANSTDSLDYKAYVAPYSVATEGYDVDTATKTNYTRMVDWITISEPTGTLAPNEHKELGFTITVPKDAAGGGQYAAIIVGTDDDNDTQDNVLVTNVLEIASVIYAQVDGEIIRKGEILENDVPGFSADSEISTSSLVKNEGNMHEIVNITIKATNALTGEVIVSSESGEGVYTELVMPDTQRFISRDIANLPMVGIVNVQQNIYYNGETSTIEKNVIICPIWLLVLSVITIIAIITSIILSVRKHKKKRAQADL